MSDHNHDHDHEVRDGADDAPGYYELLEITVRELLIAKQLITAAEIRRQLEVLDSRTPAMGARIVARAWVDPAFKDRLLADGRKACEEFGVTFYDDTSLIVLENTETEHNLICCTLCSCYPRPVLGLPPDWYKQKPYRARNLGATQGLGRVRHDRSRRRGRPCRRLHGHDALHGPAASTGGNGEFSRGGVGRTGNTRHDDWCRTPKHEREES